MDQLTPELALTGTAVTFLAWRFPWAGLGFVALGAVPYYAALHALSVETSGALTGGVFVGAGLGAVVRLGRRRVKSLGRMWNVLGLLAAFLAIWYLRWAQDPPQSALAGDILFAERASVFMLGFAVLPFLGGAMTRDEADLRKLLRALAAWGGVGLGIGLAYWAAAMPNQGPEWSSKWEPIPYLNGITFALEVSLGCVALSGILWNAREPRARLIRWAALAAAAALVLRIGQRGPFLAFLLGLATLLFSSRERLTKRLVATLVVGVVVSGIAIYVGEAHTTRSFAASSYTREANEARLEIIAMGLERIAERPLTGWGGSLVGEIVGNERWKYLHISVLDPLIEAGLFGAIPFWMLVGLALRAFARLYRARWMDASLRVPVLAFFAAALLESLFSGHVSGARHLWLMTGLILAMNRWRRVRSAREPGTPHAIESSRVSRNHVAALQHVPR